MNHRVYLDRISTAGYLSIVRQGLRYIDFGRSVTPDALVFVKPNLTFPTYRPGVMTSLPAIEAAIQAIREYTSHIYVGDADSGGYNRFSMDQVYRETGMHAMAERYGVHVVNLSRLERRTITFEARGRRFSLGLPRLLTDDIDLLVTMPVPKVHSNTGVSLTFKNQWGCIPEPDDRLRLHPYLDQVVLEVSRAVKARVAIVDGTFGLNRNGPMRGDPVELDWMLVADSLGAGARVACALMQVPLEEIRHLRYAQAQGLIPGLDAISLSQDVHPFLGEKFVLRRKWTDIPGLLAFRSPLLAYLGYFSPLAGSLHRLLYLFREPFYHYTR
ncbi:MAG TPA: DUF362 domain-containing protein [Anaerolineae bacterium]|nr:DUF362 domain-containing protein [Anaerolineae bacterium]